MYYWFFRICFHRVLIWIFDFIIIFIIKFYIPCLTTSVLLHRSSAVTILYTPCLLLNIALYYCNLTSDLLTLSFIYILKLLYNYFFQWFILFSSAVIMDSSVMHNQLMETWVIWYIDEGFFVWIIPLRYQSHESTYWARTIVLSYLFISSFDVLFLSLTWYYTCIIVPNL